VSKIYVDGCSFTYGQGLPRNYALGALLSADIDMAKPNKSNSNIVYDTYSNLDLADIFIIGFTFSDRTTLWDGNTPIGINASKLNLDRLSHPQGEQLENDYKSFHRVFYSLYNKRYMYRMSDFYLDGLISLLESKQKKYVLYSWEKRSSIFNNIFYPYIEQKLPDGHLNEQGMLQLAEEIKKRL